MKTTSISITIHETKSFTRAILAAFDEMEREGLDALAIPDSMGMMLVRRESAAEAAHFLPGNVLYEKQIEGQAFLVCLS